MFENVGKKLKTVAKVFCWIGIAIFGFIGILVIIRGIFTLSAATFFIGVLYIILGFFISWIGSLSMYAFGQLVENSDKTVKLLVKLNTKPKTTNSYSATKAAKFCRTCGAVLQKDQLMCHACGSTYKTDS